MGSDKPSAETLAATPMPASPEPLSLATPSVFEPGIERFAIGEELGRGGMGVVVAATDQTLEREVAIKQALASSPEDLARFEREVRITAQLEHPAIVPIHDVGRDAHGRPYYIMRRIAGDPLSTRVTRATQVRDRLALVSNVLAAVDAAAFAHARGVIHRDIKPWNILIGAYGETLLIDWGLARRVEEPDDAVAPTRTAPRPPELTVAGLAYGTPGYMAPEQARGERADARADVYALGATLFHVLAGRPPVEGKASSEWLERARSHAVDLPLDDLPDGVPRELVAIVAKATANDPAARYADAGALAADLRAFLAGQLVAAHRYTALERLGRFVRRHRIAVATAAIALVALVVGGVVAIVNVVRERERADVLEMLADERADHALLERASTLAAIDPTRAVALLRFAHDPHSLPRAREIAANAAAHGIAHGLDAHSGPVFALAISADGKRLVSGGTDGKLLLHDLETRASRTLAIPPSGTLSTAAWLDDNTLVYVAETGVFRHELATGATTRIGPNVFGNELWIEPDRIRYLDRGRLVEITPTGDHERTIASDADIATCRAGVVLVDSATSLRVIDERGERVIVTHGPPSWNRSLAISYDGTRIAAYIDRDVVEWDRTSGRELRRWTKQLAQSLFYAGSELHVIDINGRLDRLATYATSTLVAGNRMKVPHVKSFATGVVIGSNEGTIVMLADGMSWPIGHEPGTRSIATTPSGSVVAIGGGDGSLRWWHTHDFIPDAVRLPDRITLCAASDDALFGYDGGEIVEMTPDGKVTRELAIPGESCTLAGNWIIGFGSLFRKIAAVDRRTGTRIVVPNPAVIDSDGRSLVYIEDNGRIVELRDRPIDRGVARDAQYLDARNGWIAVATSDHLIRIRPDGAVSTLALPVSVTNLTITGGGGVWFTHDRDLYYWKSTLSHVVTLSNDVAYLEGQHTDQVAIQLQDSTMWVTTPDGNHVLRARSASTGDMHTYFGVGSVAIRNFEGLDVIHVDSGERLARVLGAQPIALVLVDDDRRLLVQTADQRVFEYRDTVPADPAALLPWIDRATNAMVSPRSDALTWRR